MRAGMSSVDRSQLASIPFFASKKVSVNGDDEAVQLSSTTGQATETFSQLVKETAYTEKAPLSYINPGEGKDELK